MNLQTQSSLANSKLPQHYQIIYENYTNKNYKRVIEKIEDVKEFHVEYSILKAACLIHLNKEIGLAHQILDNLLQTDPNNSYSTYAKGLAYYHESKWEEAVSMFERARELDMSPDMERSEVMRVKALQKISDINDDDSVENPQDPKQSNRILGSGRRYGCEICGHYFGKKFNLDRHNRSIHKRGTPEDFPNNSESIDQQITLKTEPEQECAVSVSVYNTHPEIEEISVRKKKRSKPNTLFLAGLKNRVKCTFCKKFFKKGSLARHMIIHTGKKNFTCNVQTCKRAFFQKSDLVRHETTHSDIMAFECEICSKKFRLKKNLQVHKRRHHFNKKH